jgi:2,3-dihydroxybiphenyl 1,2-dioxygenase
MQHLSSLGYVVLGVSDLAAWEEFATGIIGFQAGHKTADSLALRMDDRPARIQLERGDENDIRAAGWQLNTPGMLADLVRQLEAAGVTVTRDPELARRRQVEDLYRCDDPAGYRHEFFCGPILCSDQDSFRSPVLQQGFVTGRLGLGHFVALCKDLDEATALYRDGMGLLLSGHIRPAGTDMKIAFFHASNGRYHSLATMRLGGPKILLHIGVELADFNDVGRALDRATAAGVVERTLGMHPNAKTVSFYLKAPGGLGIEMFFGEIVCDDDTWKVETYPQISNWGHKPVV